MKRLSSLWIKTKDSYLADFYWQNGYGAFSVGKFDLGIVQTYIENQESHHAEKTFQIEYRKMLDDHKVKFDEQYV